jgi:hypothetical protein
MSDHFSGPRAIAGPAGDICDVYAFPSPERPGHLVLVMNVLPQAGADARFSDAIVHRFRLRPLGVAATGPAAPFRFGPPQQEIVFDVSFDAPRSVNDGRGAGMQTGRCSATDGRPVEFVVNDDRGGRADGLRVFAGLRSDPFFMDVPAWRESVIAGRLAFKPAGTNSLEGFNVLSVVVEVDCAPLLQARGGPLFAVVGETVVAGKLPIRIERVGRPEMKNVMLVWKDYDPVNRDLELRDIYNLEDAFHMSKDYRGAYRARLNANLAVFDRLDGKTDWPQGADGTHPLTELLLADYLVVDVSKPYADDSFLEIERALLQGRAHATCGGRSLNEDTMDTLYTLLISGAAGPRIGDGVDQATVPAGRVFPYLAPPNPPSAGTTSRPSAPHAEKAVVP